MEYSLHFTAANATKGNWLLVSGSKDGMKEMVTILNVKNVTAAASKLPSL